MPSDFGRGKKASNIALEVVKAYLKKKGDKNALFKHKDLKEMRVDGYEVSGLYGLTSKNIVEKKYKKDDPDSRSSRTWVYGLGGYLKNLSLDQILKISYRAAAIKCNHK